MMPAASHSRASVRACAKGLERVSLNTSAFWYSDRHLQSAGTVCKPDPAAMADGVAKSLTAAAVVRDHGGTGPGALVVT
eukprot:4538472-Prymnesium_polylepis.2